MDRVGPGYATVVKYIFPTTMSNYVFELLTVSFCTFYCAEAYVGERIPLV